MANKSIDKIKKSLENNGIDIPEIKEAINSVELDLFGVHEAISCKDMTDREKLNKVKELLFEA